MKTKKEQIDKHNKEFGIGDPNAITNIEEIRQAVLSGDKKKMKRIPSGLQYIKVCVEHTMPKF